MNDLTGVRLPLAWDEFDLPNPFKARSTVLTTGEPAWAWSAAPPDLPVATCESGTGEEREGWGLDHVVLLVPDLSAIHAALTEVGLSARLRMDVRGRPTAFYRVGPVLEVIESPVRAPALFGVALVTDELLEVVVLRWRAMGHDMTDPRQAIQPGRRITTVRGTEAGLAVMSPDRAMPT